MLLVNAFLKKIPQYCPSNSNCFAGQKWLRHLYSWKITECSFMLFFLFLNLRDGSTFQVSHTMFYIYCFSSALSSFPSFSKNILIAQSWPANLIRAVLYQEPKLPHALEARAVCEEGRRPQRVAEHLFSISASQKYRLWTMELPNN